MNDLTIDHDWLAFRDGHSFFVQRGSLTWPLYGLYLNEGELAAAKIMQDRRAVGANTISLIGMWSRYANLHPSNPTYWNLLRPFCQIAADEGMRLQWVVLADTKPSNVWLDMPAGVTWPGMPALADQKAHWERFLVTLGDFKNCTFIVANQPSHPSQTITANQTKEFVKPSDFQQLLCARNNPFEASNPVLPPMDFSCACTKRSFPYGHAELAWSMYNYVFGNINQAAWPGTRQVTIAFEMPRIQEGNGWDNPGLWRRMGRQLCELGTGGGNVYSDQDRFAQIYSGVTRDCAVEFLGNIPNP